jgi:hypothetical protein
LHDNFNYPYFVALLHQSTRLQHYLDFGDRSWYKCDFACIPHSAGASGKEIIILGKYEHFDQSWSQFLLSISEQIVLINNTGKAIIEKTYLDILAGRSQPNQGYMLSL